eukprot:GHVT01094403.1.p1 GENE.GHVT01094403.1~~GHVT01094403.1.p1  ORF type:complete len:148 (-),score=2.22 GHVT01094403.1:71-514(-)
MEGSNLSGVSSKCSWEEPNEADKSEYSEDDKENRLHSNRLLDRRTTEEKPRISDYESDQIKATLRKGLVGPTSKPVLPPIKGDHSTHSDNTYHDANADRNRQSSRKESFDSTGSSEAPTELLRTRILDNVHLKFNLEAGALLPLALR